MTRARDLSRLGNRNAITASSTNNIGIGSTIPDTKLDVVGDVFVTGVVTATSYSGDGSALTGIAATANVVTDSLVVSGVSTFNGNVNIDNVTTELSSIVNVRKADGGNLTAQFDSGGQATLYYDGTQRIQTQTNGVVVNGKFTVQAGDINVSAGGTVGSDTGITTYYGDGQYLTGIAAGGGSGEFNTGITTTLIDTATGIGTTVLTLPSTAGQQYVISSILATNVATGNTEVNAIGAFDFTSGYRGGERSYFAYNVPVPTGTAVELLEQPQVLNPNDRITVRSTDVNRNGVDDSMEVFITYEQQESSDYFGVGVSTTGLGVTTPVGIYTSSSNPSIIQSIRVVNRTDDGPYPVTVSITSGVTTTNLVDNLIVPKYASVELITKQKRIGTGDEIKVTVDQIETIAVQVSGKQVTS